MIQDYTDDSVALARNRKPDEVLHDIEGLRQRLLYASRIFEDRAGVTAAVRNADHQGAKAVAEVPLSWA
jgi:hypothetical protein